MYKVLDTIVLTHDVPAAALQAGDLGAIVEIEGEVYTVEFVAVSGRTQALLTLTADDIRPTGDRDVLAARPLEPLSWSAGPPRPPLPPTRT